MNYNSYFQYKLLSYGFWVKPDHQRRVEFYFEKLIKKYFFTIPNRKKKLNKSGMITLEKEAIFKWFKIVCGL